MKIDDLLSSIALGEDSARQFKADVKNSDALASEMAAFANTEGGTIFIGVANDGSGIKRALEKWPDIDFTDDRDCGLFTATVHRNVISGSGRPAAGV
jgi:predicted HTH transcriptional regulator